MTADPVADPVAEQAAAELVAKVTLQVDAAVKAAIQMLRPVAFEIAIAEIRASVPSIKSDTNRRMFDAILADEEKTAMFLGRQCASKWRADAGQVAGIAMDKLRASDPQAAVRPESLFHAALGAMLLFLSERAVDLVGVSETQTSERQET
jgi:hypothetical protein